MNNLLRILCSLLLTSAVSFGARPAWAESAEETRWLDVEVGQSLVWSGDRAVQRMLVSDPAVAEIKSLEQDQIQIRGVEVGSTDLWVWFRDTPSRPVSYEIVVHQDLSELVRRIGSTVRGTPPRVYSLKSHIAVDGAVDDVETLERIDGLARAFDKDYVNLMTIKGDHQVQLHVVFAEVSRSGLREMGLSGLGWGSNFFAGMYGPNLGDPVTVARENGEGTTWYAPSSGTFQILGSYWVGDLLLSAFFSVLESNDLSKILAEPTLVALSGQEAEFLAGGEVPIAVYTNNQVSIQYKEYGVKLVFVPTVLAGDVVDLRVYTEVSDVDPTNSVRAGGLAVPGFVKRKGSSHLRLENGKTFAMAGMLSENIESSRSEVPILGRIPLIGAAFRYVKHEREESEIMIFVTPELVRPLAGDEVPPPPTASEDNHPNDLELFLLGLDHRAGSRDIKAAGPVGMER